MKTVIEYLLELIRIPSVSSISNRQVVNYASEVFREAGWDASTTAHIDTNGIEKLNLITAPPGQNPNDPIAELAFLCHTDTVPFAPEWDGALKPIATGDVVYGCGACDVKGFLACLLAAVSETETKDLKHGLRIVLTADEEIGCLGANRLLASALMNPRCLVIGEPTSLYPARAGKGYCLAEVTVSGEEAHSAHPFQGRSAIYGAAQMIREIEIFARRLAEERNNFFDPAFTTLNIGTIHGGTAKNVVPGRCSFLVEWRPIPGNADEIVAEAIVKIGNQILEVNPDFRFDLKILRQQSGFETAPKSDLVRTMEHLTGRQSISIPFGSEANVFASLVKEIIVFGPGDMRTAHSPRECVPVSELTEAVSYIKKLMQKCGQ
ncbi:acetylornithine deacetylase [Tunturiibacter lichenicola]|uniref:acetylornithine deacetylase n=1 Tax=Tunturiibacter lichenicola TaxID=2051959 RepID=UPI003D9B13F6